MTLADRFTIASAAVTARFGAPNPHAAARLALTLGECCQDAEDAAVVLAKPRTQAAALAVRRAAVETFAARCLAAAAAITSDPDAAAVLCQETARAAMADDYEAVQRTR
jgi:hypothetical protein